MEEERGQEWQAGREGGGVKEEIGSIELGAVRGEEAGLGPAGALEEGRAAFGRGPGEKPWPVGFQVAALILQN